MSIFTMIVKSWIINSGASDHMTPIFSHLILHVQVRINLKLPMGKYHTSLGQVQLNVPLTLSLSLIIHVLNFSINLLSVSRVTKMLNWSISLFITSCIFQHLTRRRTICRDIAYGGLYLLESSPSLSTKQKLVKHCK